MGGEFLTKQKGAGNKSDDAVDERSCKERRSTEDHYSGSEVNLLCFTITIGMSLCDGLSKARTNANSCQRDTGPGRGECRIDPE